MAAPALRQAAAATTAAAPPLRSLLSPFGIGISKYIALTQSSRSGVSLTTTENVAAGAPLLVVPDAALLTSQTALDADADGLVPPPAEMLEMCPGDAVRLDVTYLAYYLSLRYFTHPNDWYAAQLDRCRAAPARAGGEAAEAALWERASHDYVSAPRPVFLAAARYVRAASFLRPATASGSANGDAAQPAALALAPAVDVLVRSPQAPNVALTSCTAKDVKTKYLSEHLRGARQALMFKEDACPYWAIVALSDIPAGGALSLSSHAS